MRSKLVPKSVSEVGTIAAGIAGAALLVRPNPNFSQLLGVRHRQCAKAHRIEQMEDGGVCTDAEREAKNRNGEEPRFQANKAERVTNILAERFEKSDGV